MPKKPMVTRTLTVINADVLCLNKQTGETYHRITQIPNSYRKERDILKEASKILDSESCKVLYIFDIQTTSNIYGMSDQEFIKHAKIIENR